MDGAVAAKLYIDNVWTRDFLDLGQNKGVFKPGAENVSIQLKDGTRFNFPNVGIPDFSAAAKNGAVTSIGGAYGISAKHYRDGNEAIVKSAWGQTDYKMVNRESRHDDFAVHRLDKFVVETKGAREGVDFSLSAEEALERYGVDFNGKKQIIGFRAGNGLTPIIKDNKQTQMGSAFAEEFFSGGIFSVDWKNPTITYSDKTAFKTMQQQGDSGSSAYLYDNKNKKWVVLGTTHYLAGSNANNLHVGYGRYDQKLIDDFKDKYTQKVSLSGKTALLTQSDYQINGEKVNLQKVNNKENKDLFFTGGGNIVLKSAVDQGSGGLIFDNGHKYNVSGDYTIKGAGIDVGAGSVVEWNAQYTTSDALHKIGEGGLDVKKKQNTNLKTGDGLTTLSVNNAFNNIYLAGGRVKLNADNALGQGDYAGVFFSKYGGALDLNGHSQRFNKIAASDNGAVITNSNISKESTVFIDSKDKYIFHGVVSGNTRIEHKNKSRSENEVLIFDGEVDVNAMDVENANLVLQGHPTDHAIFRDGPVKCIIPNILCDADRAAVIQQLESEANNKNNTAYKSNNQVSDFSQPDWDSRRFRVGELSLRDASLSVGRGATVEGNISAHNSTVTIGDKTSYIDSFSGNNIVGSGFSFRQNVISGKSTGKSDFIGGLTANNSHVVIGDQATATMTDNVTLTNTKLNVKESGKLIVKGGMYTSGNIDVEGGALSFSGKPLVSTPDNKVYSPTVNLIDGRINLIGDGTAFEAKDQTSVTGDIYSEASSSLKFGSGDKTSLDKKTPQEFSVGLLNGFSTAFRGAIYAPRADATMEDTWWQVTGNSSLNKLKSNHSMIHFTGREKFQTLTVDELTSSHNAFVMRTDFSGADKLVVKKSLEGEKNTLLVDFLDKKNAQGKLSLELVSAPKGTKGNVFESKSQSIGFSDVTPVIERQEQSDKVAWVLTGYDTKVNPEAVKKAENLMGMGYKSFLTEVNNLNKRMGDLRDNHGEAGAWARMMDGSGSSQGGYSNNYEHVQVGADKQTELEGADMYTGLTMTYTDNNFSDHGLSGRTTSVGWGVYASTLFKSGAYVDLIGKYIHHNNEYVADLAGLGKKSYSSHSLYLGSEVGYRHYISDSLWIEPQAELTYGAVSGRELNWNDGNMALTLKNDGANPLVGRYGFDVGKQFGGENWRLTARAGVSHQFDILASGETVLRDVSGEQRIKNNKDGRMLMNVGLSAEVNDNLRAGLELEKSVFGKYNIDSQINFNIRYSF